MLTRSQENSLNVSDVYLQAFNVIEKRDDWNVKLCKVYEVCEALPVTSRILPVLKCMTNLTSSTINEDACKTVQRLLISISNLSCDKANAGRSSVYNDNVFHLLALITYLSPSLIERNQNSLLKIVDCALNHLLFLVNTKKTEKFRICNDILAALMQQLNIAKTNDKIIHSVIYLTQSEDVGIKPEAIYYGNLSTKALRHSAIYVLWSLNEYLMEHQQKNTDFKVPLNEFLDAIKFTYESNNSTLQKICTNQLGTLLKFGGVDTRKLFPQICEELDFSYDHPVIVHAFNAVLHSC